MDYQRLYDELIEKARSENRVKIKGGTYYEAHHIIPKCMGGEGKCSEWRAHPNIILLTAGEHFIAHYYLIKIYPDNSKLGYAFWSMCNMISNGRRVDRDYSEILNFAGMYQDARGVFAKISSEARKGKQSYNKGRILPEETKTKISTSLKGKTRSEETKAKISTALRGRTLSKELVAKRSAKQWKPINQLNLRGDLIRQWPSQKEAMEATGIISIRNALIGRAKTAGGYIWKYA